MKTFRKSFHLKAPISKVWEALTKPALIKQYFFGTETDTDWKKGSPIYFRGTWDGKQYEDKGTIADIAPEKFVQYTYWSAFSGTEDKPENYSNVRYELSPATEGTLLTITQDGFDSEEKLAHSETSWSQVMEGLRKLVEE